MTSWSDSKHPEICCTMYIIRSCSISSLGLHWGQVWIILHLKHPPNTSSQAGQQVNCNSPASAASWCGGVDGWGWGWGAQSLFQDGEGDATLCRQCTRQWEEVVGGRWCEGETWCLHPYLGGIDDTCSKVREGARWLEREHGDTLKSVWETLKTSFLTAWAMVCRILPSNSMIIKPDNLYLIYISEVHVVHL